MTGGCDFQLSPTDWNYVSTINAGGDPVTVTVRAAPSDLSCISGSNSRMISYATEPLSGGIYYWQSIVFGTVAGKAGGIYRKDFGNPDPTPEPFLTPTAASNKCVGCHYLSRDGAKMVIGTDDADSDDELGDDHFFLYDVTTRAPTMLQNMAAKGFGAWQGTAHGSFAMSDGGGMSTSPILFFPIDGTAGTGNTSVSFATTTGLTGKRITNPDWSRDGSMVYFTATTPITGITGYPGKDDIHSKNGSIWQVSFANNAFGTPTEIVTPANASENDYYPAISPDGTALIFDRALANAAGTIDSLDSYNNPGATLYAMIVPGGAPIALANANLHDQLTNSWPRWSPAVQHYKGHRLLWVTFSSTRDYGLVVQNEGPSFFNCYPPVSPEDPSNDHTKPFDPNCTQPQIWMAAIDLDALSGGTDGSFPAFWLPFQTPSAHNHIAQWVDSINTQNCSQIGQSCAMGCCTGLVCDTTSMMCISNIP
jgi:TolB protein